jgi:ribonuclease P protein component
VGVIVTRKTGNAVLRNTLRRRVRAICRSLLDAGTLSGDLVIRFRDETPSPSFAELDREIRSAVDRWLGP